MAFSLVLHGTVPKDEICGVIVGHSMHLLHLGHDCRDWKLTCIQYGTSLATSTPRYTVASDRSTLHNSGEIFSKERHQIQVRHQSIMRLQLLRRRKFDNEVHSHGFMRYAFPGVCHCSTGQDINLLLYIGPSTGIQKIIRLELYGSETPIAYQILLKLAQSLIAHNLYCVRVSLINSHSFMQPSSLNPPSIA